MSNRPLFTRPSWVHKVKELPKSCEQDTPEPIGLPIIVTIGSERFAISCTLKKLKPASAEVTSISQSRRNEKPILE